MSFHVIARAGYVGCATALSGDVAHADLEASTQDFGLWTLDFSGPLPPSARRFRPNPDMVLHVVELWKTVVLTPLRYVTDRGLVTLSALLPILSDFVPYDCVPTAVVQATCEMARELLVADRTAAPPGEGIDTVATVHATHAASGTGSSSDSSSTKYSKGDTRPIISAVALAMLAKFGAAVSGGSGVVRLVRA